MVGLSKIKSLVRRAANNYGSLYESPYRQKVSLVLEPIHVCVLTTAHPIDDVRVNHKFAHAFSSAGFHISWVGPEHAFFDSENYNLDGIKFNLGPPIRSRVDRLLTAHRIRPVAEKLSKVDVYYAPEPDSARIAIKLARHNGAKVIFDIHEIYHGALLDRWLFGHKPHFIRECLRRQISRIAARCDQVLGVSDAVLAPYKTEKTRTMVVRSCAPAWFARGEPANVCGADQKYFTIMHGKSNILRGTMEVTEGASITRIENLRIIMFESAVTSKDISQSKLISRINELGLNEVIDLRPGIPMQNMPAVLRTCNAGLIAYGRKLGADSLPNRLFEYMAIGLAIIAPVYAREIAKIIESEQCGILVDFEDPADIARAIMHLWKNPQICREMGRRAREAFLTRHNWEAEVRPVIDCIKKWKSAAAI